MFTKAINKATGNIINGCKLIEWSKKTKDFPFCSHILLLNRKNQIGIEYNKVGIRNQNKIRIDGVETSDEKSFSQMMDALVEHAKHTDYGKLMFCDELNDDVLDMFLQYGFCESEKDGSLYNNLLYLTIDENNGASIRQEA